MAEQKRPYRKRRRAELEDQTRQRIAASAVELHGSVGPARTTFSAVAELAGVRRSTLYRHFPDEAALFAACRAHWVAANPFPDQATWAAIADPDRRLTHALAELYAYYRQTEQMLANLIRDEDTVPAVKQSFAAFRAYLSSAQEILMRGRKLRGRARERTLAATGHALAFTTWRSLTGEQGLQDDQAVELMHGFVAGQTRDRRRRPTARSRT